MMNLRKIVKAAEGLTKQVTTANLKDLGKVVKAAEGLTKQVTTANLKDLGNVVKDTVGQMAPTEHQENEENFHPEHKKYFSAPKI